MPWTIKTASGTISNLEEWFEHAPPKSGAKHWKDGRSAKEIARAWCPEGRAPEAPPEFAELLRTNGFPNARIEEVRPESRLRFDALPGEPRNADLAIVARDPEGPIAITVEAKADEPFGDRVDSMLTSLGRRIGRDENTNGVLRIQQLAARLLPAWKKELPHLGELRYQLLTAVAGTVALAEELGATRAILVVHELIDKSETKEAARRKNRVDLDQFVKRLTGEPSAELRRNGLVGPLGLPGYPGISFYLGKARRDLD